MPTPTPPHRRDDPESMLDAIAVLESMLDVPNQDHPRWLRSGGELVLAGDVGDIYPEHPRFTDRPWRGVVLGIDGEARTVRVRRLDNAAEVAVPYDDCHSLAMRSKQIPPATTTT